MNLPRLAPRNTADQVEKILVSAILKGELPPGSRLPNERDLAARLGVTRPTLRETLKQLANQGWLHIRHGKPTLVADYWQEGGLGVLATLARHGEALSPEMVGHLLQVRAVLLPPVARAAARRRPGPLREHLGRARGLPNRADDYTRFDWELQVLFCRCSGNPVFNLILNDFAGAYTTLAGIYFQGARERRRSRGFYHELARALEQGRPVEPVVRRALEESARVWEDLQPGGRESHVPA